MKSNILLVGALLLLVASCKKDVKETDPIEDPQEIRIDTSVVSYNLQIGNDPARVEVTTISNNDAKDFSLDFFHKNEKKLSRSISKSDLIELNSSKLFLDSLTQDHTKDARLVDFKYQFVRGNTLYFEAMMRNEAQKKRIYGRFNMFYQTYRKGEIYGWITDSVKPIN